MRRSPTGYLKVRLTPLLPLGLEIDLGWIDDPLPVKALEDGLMEREAPEVQWVAPGIKNFLDFWVNSVEYSL